MNAVMENEFIDAELTYIVDDGKPLFATLIGQKKNIMKDWLLTNRGKPVFSTAAYLQIQPN